ncbi:MAG TPA: YgiQ family radical SAM protein [Paludibacteraceae bacterium]|nr:YgiQ family radical SAM protein [Paludibacteraceae bacterium]HPL94175.1 YgiQ family radical SAM protein [Paludibacteraceae bacterium]
MYNDIPLSSFLPTTQKEIKALGWEELDVILFSGDAYIDHPSFGIAVMGRILEQQGLKVAIVPQPNWRDDLRDFKKLGKPRLFFGVSAGSMDSMVNHYTANKRLRSNDAYTPEGRAGYRPDYATVTYCTILKSLYPDTPIVIGGVEASLRRVTHYDYWSDKLLPSILVDSQADLLVYGMGEKAIVELVQLLQQNIPFQQLHDIPQTAFLIDKTANSQSTGEWESLSLFSHEECIASKINQAKNFRVIEEHSNSQKAGRLLQDVGTKTVIINPPYPTMTEKEIDQTYTLPYTRLPHPRYKGKTIPAYEMIKHSVTLHRGCFGGCAFCTISAHQGKFIASRSEKSILAEIEKITQMPDFKGYISDIGGPSANMYKMQGIDLTICEKCKKPSCIHPKICKNLDTNHAPLIELYKKVRSIKEIKKAFVGSGIRYDMILHKTGNKQTDASNMEYANELIAHHVSGRLKVAPEHTNDEVLNLMRKPSFEYFETFVKLFNEVNKQHHLNQQLIPYFISSHPGCKQQHMAELAAKTKALDFKLEQVQDFTPTPMTLATEMYYTGIHPYTLEKISTPNTPQQKLNQRKFFFWYQKEYKNEIINDLKKMNRMDLIKKLYP